jgi:DNA modification methylase
LEGLALKIENRRIIDLKPAEYNPRKALTPDDAEYQNIKRSIETFGYVDPIIINNDGTIIGGHQRCTVLSDLGYEEVEVVVVDLNKQDEKALNVALNKITGEWDNLKLKDLLIELDLGDYDISVTGFSNQDLENLIELTDFEPEVSEDEFDADEAYNDSAAGEPLVKRGEVWQLGRHRLMCGDSTDIDDVQKLMGAELMDLIITDPPYNVNYEEKAAALNKYRPNNNGSMVIENDVLDWDDFYTFLFRAFISMAAYMREGAAIYVFHSDNEGLTFRRAFDDAGLTLRQVLVWEKNNFVLGMQDYHWRHEPILYGQKDGARRYFINDRTQDTVILEDDVDFEAMKKPELIQYIKDMMHRYADQTSVIYEKKPMSNNLHPTMKPLELIAKLMKNSSKKGWNVGDLFGGSGSTLMAAEQLGRNAYMMEYDEHYASVIIKRWEDFTGQQAVRIEV